MSAVPSAAADLALREVTKRYPGQEGPAVDGLTLDVAAANAKVDIDKDDPEEVAKAFLESKGLLTQ